MLTFNFCTEKEKERKHDNKLVYSDIIFAFKLAFALGDRRGQEGQEHIKAWQWNGDQDTSVHKMETLNPHELVIGLARDPLLKKENKG